MKEQVQVKNLTLEELTKKAKDSFQKFNEGRGFNLEAVKAELKRKENQLSELHNQAELRTKENDEHKVRI